MKKKILLSLLFVMMLFVTGCGNRSSNSSSKSNSNTFKIKDTSFVFNQDSEFYDFKYKNSKELTIDDSKYSRHLEYKNSDIYDGRFVYRLSLSYTDESNLEKFLDGYESKKVKINGITWQKAIVKSKTDNKDTKAVVYATEKNSVLFAVTAVIFTESGVDVDGLAETFMNGVTLK